MGSSDPPYPLPLPAGWVDRGTSAGHRIASRGPAVLVCQAAPPTAAAGAAGTGEPAGTGGPAGTDRPDDAGVGADDAGGPDDAGVGADDAGVGADGTGVGAAGTDRAGGPDRPGGGPFDARHEVLVLDSEPVRCRGGGTADRTLVAVTDERGRSLTVEHWRYPPGQPVSEAVAVLPTGAYAQLEASCTAALRGRRSAAAPAAAPAPGPPRAELRVTVLTGRHGGAGTCRLAEGIAWMDLPGLDSPGSPREVPSSALPGWLAGLVGLGPRPRAAVTGLLVTSRPTLDRLLALPAADPDGVRDAFAPSTLPDGWAGALAAVAGAPAHWRMELTVPGAGAAALEVLDAGAGGLWSLAAVDPALLGSEQDGAPLDGEPVAVSPTTPSAIWRWLAPLAG